MGNLRPIERDPQRSEAPADQYHRRIDDVTGEVWLCKGDALAEAEDNIERVAKLTQATTIVGQDGDILAVDADGRASVSVQGIASTTPRSRAIAATSWRALIDGSAATTAFEPLKPCASLALLVADSVNAAAYGAASFENPDGWPCALFMFGGTDLANETYNYIVHRAYEITIGGNTSWVATSAATGVVTLGAETYGAAGTALGATGNFMANTITETTLQPGSAKIANAGEGMAMLLVNFLAAPALIIEVETGAPSAATMDVFATYCDASLLAGFAT